MDHHMRKRLSERGKLKNGKEEGERNKRLQECALGSKGLDNLCQSIKQALKAFGWGTREETQNSAD